MCLRQRTPKEPQIGDLKVIFCFIYETLGFTKWGACGNIFEWIMELAVWLSRPLTFVCRILLKRATTGGQPLAFITKPAKLSERATSELVPQDDPCLDWTSPFSLRHLQTYTSGRIKAYSPYNLKGWFGDGFFFFQSNQSTWLPKSKRA